jgi:hypothetical protein
VRKIEANGLLSLSYPTISRERLDLVQATLTARNSKNTPPRVVNGPTLLTGLARCDTCGSGMILSTGKVGRCRYCACAGCALKGKSVCQGRLSATRRH